MHEAMRPGFLVPTLCTPSLHSHQVWVSEEDASAISEHLQLSLTEFDRDYAKTYAKYSGWRLLRNQRGSVSTTIGISEEGGGGGGGGVPEINEDNGDGASPRRGFRGITGLLFMTHIHQS